MIKTPSSTPFNGQSPAQRWCRGTQPAARCRLGLFAEKGLPRPPPARSHWLRRSTLPPSATTLATRPGLYRAVFSDPRCNPNVSPESVADASLSLREALHRVMRSFLEPLKQGQLIQHCMKLHFREMLEPTGVWQEEIDCNINPATRMLVDSAMPPPGAGQRPTTTSTGWLSPFPGWG
jgi:hypothetical protein